MKINKTDNCARACHLHQGGLGLAICPAAVDFRTNITCQCHYLDKPPSLPVNILITSSPSAPERPPPPLLRENPRELRGGCWWAVPSLLEVAIVWRRRTAVPQVQHTAAALIWKAPSSWEHLRSAPFRAEPRESRCTTGRSDVVVLWWCICDVLFSLFRKPELLPAGIGLARTAF